MASNPFWGRDRRPIIGSGEKLAEIYLGPYVGGGIEYWFAYMLALGFLMFRQQGLLGEVHIDRV